MNEPKASYSPRRQLAIYQAAGVFLLDAAKAVDGYDDKAAQALMTLGASLARRRIALRATIEYRHTEALRSMRIARQRERTAMELLGVNGGSNGESL